VDEAADLGAKHCLLIGNGETFSRQSVIVPLLRQIKRRGFWAKTSTNGTLLTDPVVEALVDSQWDFLTFSIDGHCAEVHDHLRGSAGIFETVLDGHRRLTDRKKRAGADKPLTDINTILCGTNALDAPKMIRFAADHGFAHITFMPYQEYVEDQPQFLLKNIPKDRLLDALHRAEETSLSLGIPSNLNDIIRIVSEGSHDPEGFTESRRTSDPGICLKPWYHIIVRSDGTVGTCCASRTTESVVDRPLSEVWFGDTFRKLRDKSLSGLLTRNCRCLNLLLEENRFLTGLLTERGFDWDTFKKHPGLSKGTNLL